MLLLQVARLMHQRVGYGGRRGGLDALLGLCQEQAPADLQGGLRFIQSVNTRDLLSTTRNVMQLSIQ